MTASHTPAVDAAEQVYRTLVSQRELCQTFIDLEAHIFREHDALLALILAVHQKHQEPRDDQA